MYLNTKHNTQYKTKNNWNRKVFILTLKILSKSLDEARSKGKFHQLGAICARGPLHRAQMVHTAGGGDHRRSKT